MTRRLIQLPLLLLLWAYALALCGYLLLRLTLSQWWAVAFLNNFAPYYFLPLLLAVPLAVPHKRLRLLMISLAGVAALWFLPRALPDVPARAAPEQTLTVVAFNVWGGNDQLGTVVDWLRETDADIVFLQETPPAFAEEQVHELLELYPYRTRAVTWGNLTLSRHPIVSNTGFDLEGDGLPYHERTLIDVHGQLVALYNIHLFMPMGGSPRVRPPVNSAWVNMLLSYDERGRNGQIERLLARLGTEEHPYIVGGDFNMSDNDRMYPVVAAHMHDSYRQAGVGFGTTWPVAGRAHIPAFIPPMIRIDYVWHSGHFATLDAWTGEPLGSDHLPVVAVLGM